MSKINVEVLLTPIRAQVDRVMMITLGFLLFVSLGIGLFYDVLLLSSFIAVPTFLVPFFIWKTAAGSFLLRIAIATALVLNVALHIQVSHGLIEMHFGVFVILAFLLAYRDWKVIVYAAALVAVHHIALNFLQSENHYNIWVFRNGADFSIVIVHALFVIFESAILVLLAVQLRKELVRLAMVAEIAERISEGDLSSKIDVDDSDFVAVLLKSMQKTQQSLNSFVVAQENLAQKHI
ncbi:MAG: Methyl-accepting chemotaxis protein, partial [Pseudomonadota bacterium]